jgi:Zn-dependent protease
VPQSRFTVSPKDGVHKPSPIFLALVAGFLTSGLIIWNRWGGIGIAVFLFVVTGWAISLCLHEYAHAVTAFHSGDTSVAAKGYLTLNPLRYSDPLLSIGLPVLFVLIGGIGLPGGAVWIERHRIPGRLRHSLVSVAGPLTNVVFALLLVLAIGAAAPTDVEQPFWAAVAYLGFLQVSASVLNLLPVPGLDGFGVLEPWLPPDTVRKAAQFSPYGLLLVFALLWIPAVNQAFFTLVEGILIALDVPIALVQTGDILFRFWVS